MNEKVQWVLNYINEINAVIWRALVRKGRGLGETVEMGKEAEHAKQP